jgi:hypothetical protein
MDFVLNRGLDLGKGIFPKVINQTLMQVSMGGLFMLHVIRPLVSKSVSKKMQLLKLSMQLELCMWSMLQGTLKMLLVSISLKQVKRFEFVT